MLYVGVYLLIGFVLAVIAVRQGILCDIVDFFAGAGLWPILIFDLDKGETLDDMFEYVLDVSLIVVGPIYRFVNDLFEVFAERIRKKDNLAE